jgi:hypothetical protein
MTTEQRHALFIPTSQPEGAVCAHFESGGASICAATWSLQTLNAGPPRSSPEYDKHLGSTVGSSYDWSDEIRFDKQTGRLTSFILKTPEAGTVDPAVASSWLALPRHAGALVLDDRDRGFHVDPLDLRCFAKENALVVTGAALPRADDESLRLAIGGDVDLLFHRNRYAGWVLGTPLAHLVAAPGDKTPGRDEPTLHALLVEYLTLVVEPNIDRMSDEDPEMRTALEALRVRIHAMDAAQARTLGTELTRVLETFYG